MPPPPRSPVRGPPPESEATAPEAVAPHRAGGVTLLVCVQGPLQGEEFPLVQDELVVGRSDACDVVLGDPSVSRRHVQLRRTARGWMVSDLGSSTGTELAGRPLTGEVRFQAGEVLAIGDTRLELREPARSPLEEPSVPGMRGNATVLEREGRRPAAPSVTGPPPAAPAAPGGARRGGGAPPVARLDEAEVPDTARQDAAGERSDASNTARLLGRDRAAQPLVTQDIPQVRPGLAARRAARPQRARKTTGMDPRKLRLILAGVLVGVVLPLCVLTVLYVKGRREEAAKEAIRRTAETRFQEGKNLLRQGNWDAAHAAFQAVSQLDPAYPVADFAARAQKERENQQQLQAAKTALDAGQLKDAAQALARVGAETQQVERLQAMRELLTRKADDRTYEAHVALDRGDVEGAKRIAAEVLAALPEHRGAIAALERADTPPPESVEAATPEPVKKGKERARKRK